MERVKLDYNKVLTEIFEDYEIKMRPMSSNKLEAAEFQVLIDEKRGHYQMLDIGWVKNKWVYYCYLHVDLKDDKIWIQIDYTDPGIGYKLLDKGVPKSDLVLGFLDPIARQLSEYGKD